MDALSLFGLVAVGFTLLCYVFEERAAGWTLGFAAGCLLSAAYGCLQGAWPFGLIELVWTAVAVARWRSRRRQRRRSRLLDSPGEGA